MIDVGVKRVSHIYGVEIVELIRTTESVGDDSGNNPPRRIRQYWTKEGRLLFAEDPMRMDIS